MADHKPTTITSAQQAVWRDYYELCKPRVVMLMLLTAIVGMFLATPGMVPWRVLILGTLGIGLAASSAAAINHIIDRQIDVIMRRTQRRPVATGRVGLMSALLFALLLCILGMLVLVLFINTLTAVLTFLTLLGYAVVYTVFLKHATPQNIVIGGLAGAAPPMLGWVAVTGHLDALSLLPVLIIFVWTPPHFWALAIFRIEEYAKAEIPMLPVTHGIAFTKTSIVLYTYLLLAVSILPFAVGMSGVIYLVGALVLGLRFLFHAYQLKNNTQKRYANNTFRYSIIYLGLLFVLMLIDHYFLITF